MRSCALHLAFSKLFPNKLTLSLSDCCMNSLSNLILVILFLLGPDFFGSYVGFRPMYNGNETSNCYFASFFNQLKSLLVAYFFLFQTRLCSLLLLPHGQEHCDQKPNIHLRWWVCRYRVWRLPQGGRVLWLNPLIEAFTLWALITGLSRQGGQLWHQVQQISSGGHKRAKVWWFWPGKLQ